MPDRRPRVLLLAEKANPSWVSVPLVGWQHVEAIMRFADAHLVTHMRNRNDVLNRGLSPQRVTFVRESRLERVLGKIALRLEGKGAMGGSTRTAFQVPAYYQFEAEAWQRLGRRVQAGEFDLVHRVTPVSPVVPSSFARHCHRAGVPFVVGPLNGGVPWPRALGDVRRAEGEWVSHLRGLSRYLPHFASTRTLAAAVIVGSAAAWKEAAAYAPDTCFYMPENGVDLAQFAALRAAPPSQPLRVAFAARLVPFKGAELLLRGAAPLVKSGQVVLDILGEGPELEKLQAIVEREQLGQGVRLPGWIAHKDLHRRLAESTVFCFPSVREFGGAVVMEAMALGLLPVVVDYGGPSEVVTDDTGWRIPVGDSAALIEGVRRTLLRVLQTPHQELVERAERCRQRIVRELSLDAKAEKTRRIYDWVLSRDARPHLEPPPHALALYA